MTEIYFDLHERVSKEPDYVDELWRNLSNDQPDLRDCIMREAAYMYPDDLEARSRATRLAIIATEATRRPNLLASIEVLWEIPAINHPSEQNLQLSFFCND